jgi:hypothetical protein
VVRQELAEAQSVEMVQRLVLDLLLRLQIEEAAVGVLVGVLDLEELQVTVL